MLRARLVTVLPRHLVVVLERLLRRLQIRRQHDVRVAVLRRPLDRIAAHDPRNPDLRVRILQRTRPRIHVAEVVVLALPAERPRRAPGLHHEIVRLLKTLPVERRLRVVRHALAPPAAHPARHQPTARNHVDLRQRLRQPERILPNRQDVPQQHDLRLLRDPRQNRRLHVHHAAHAERRRMMLVQHQRVEAHLLRVELLVQVAVIELRAHPRVVGRVARVEVRQVQPRCAEEARLRVLVRALGEIADQHRGLAICMRTLGAMWAPSVRGVGRARSRVECQTARGFATPSQHTRVWQPAQGAQPCPHLS